MGVWGRGVLDEEHGGKSGCMYFNGFFFPQELVFGEGGGKGVTKVHFHPTLGASA
jgi:hypothetical protein